MPSKRSKSKDQERKRKARENMTEEEIEQLKDKNRAAQKLKRERMSNKEKLKAKAEEKERMKIQYGKRKINTKKVQDISDEVKKEYEDISDKYRKQNARSKRSIEEHTEDKISAKKGMQEFREYGRLRKFSKRCKRNTNELSDWKRFMQKGEQYSEVLTNKKPDLIDRLNKEIREEKERKREEREKEKGKKKKEKKECGTTMGNQVRY